MIKNDNIVSYFFLIVDHHLIAALTEGLDNFGRLWTSATAALGTKSLGGASANPVDRPGLAVGNEYSSRSV